jgi:hypothetical protein
MRTFLVILFLCCMANLASAQKYVYTIKADSTRLTGCDSDELIIENHTQAVPGFLFNTGNGRTQFRRAFIQLDDTTFLLGGDTMRTSLFSLWRRNGNNIYNINTGNVGIGRINPNVLLDLPGPINIDDSSAYRIGYHPVFRVGGFYDTVPGYLPPLVLNAYTNVYAGDSSGLYNSGTYMTAVGTKTGFNNTGIYGTFLGYNAGMDNTGDDNTFVGTQSGQNNSPDTTMTNLSGTGSGDSFFGAFSGTFSSGYANTFLGNSTGIDNEGDENVMGGSVSGSNNTGNQNCFLGIMSGQYNTGNLNVILGYNSGNDNAGSYNTLVGGMAGNNNQGEHNVSVGYNAGNNNHGSGAVIVGDNAGENNWGSENVLVGHYAGFNTSETNVNYNTFIGSYAGEEAYNSSHNIAVGVSAGSQLSNGNYNILIGDSNVGYFSYPSQRNYNIMVGADIERGAYIAGTYSESYDTYLGSQVNLNGSTSGANNTFVGALAGANGEEDSSYNTFLSAESGNNGYAEGGYNTFLGAQAGYSCNIISGVTVVGALATANVNGSDNISNATAIGYNAAVNTSNTMVFGNSAVSSWLFNANAVAPSGATLVVGYNSTNGNGAYLSTGGVWTNASDRNKKEHFQTVDKNDLLQKIAELPISRWNYKGLSDQHIGPVAQDFYKIFSVGSDDKTISTIDPSGIALAGVQGLYQLWKDAENRVEIQQKKIDELESKLQEEDLDLRAQIIQMKELITKLSSK